jgi:hypothetical protein
MKVITKDTATSIKEIDILENSNLKDCVLITKDEFAALKKKREDTPGLVTELDKVKHQKYILNATYGKVGSTQEWFEKYNKIKLIKSFRNLNGLYEKKNDLYQTVDNHLCKLHFNERTNVTDQDGIVCFDEAFIGKLIFNPQRFQKHKLLLGWIKELGFDSIRSSRSYLDKDFKKSLKKFQNKYIIDDLAANKVVSLLGKKRACKKPLQALLSNSDTYIKRMLSFINGSLTNEFGLSIKRKKQLGSYYLVNCYTSSGIFATPSTYELHPDSPLLGKGINDVAIDDED